MRIAEPGWSRRWVVGTGGFIGEVTLQAVPPEYQPERRFAQRDGIHMAALTNLYVHPLRRGNGWAAKLLTTATRYADRHELDLMLWALPYGEAPGAPTKSLLRLYEEFGFVRFTPRSKKMARYYDT